MKTPCFKLISDSVIHSSNKLLDVDKDTSLNKSLVCPTQFSMLRSL